MPVIKYNDNGTIHRVFTEAWANSSVINYDKLPDYVANVLEPIKENENNLINVGLLPVLIKGLIAQRQSMVNYIQELHNEIDILRTPTNMK